MREPQRTILFKPIKHTILSLYTFYTPYKFYTQHTILIYTPYISHTTHILYTTYILQFYTYHTFYTQHSFYINFKTVKTLYTKHPNPNLRIDILNPFNHSGGYVYTIQHYQSTMTKQTIYRYV